MNWLYNFAASRTWTQNAASQQSGISHRKINGSIRPTGLRLQLAWLVVVFGVAASTQSVAQESTPRQIDKSSARLASVKTPSGTTQTNYRLTTQQGPWMIFAASFAGDSAEKEATDLVLELRKKWRLPTYLYSERFDYSKPVPAIGLKPDGSQLQLQYRLPIAYDEIAVLVGNFPSVNDPQLQKTLDFVKHAHPACLEAALQGEKSSMRYVGLRSWNRRHSNEENRKKGLMGQAFITRNPLLPEEFFAPKGIDALVASINSGVQNSLLECPGKYSVRVASFRGNVIIDQREVKEVLATNRMESRLVEAAEKAHRLTELLRKRGVDAYVFHDRHESIVTIGSFESVGTPRDDGMTEINPAVHRIMKEYGPQQQALPGGQMAGLMPKMIGGIPLDLQPVPVAVPKRSVATDYRRSTH